MGAHNNKSSAHSVWYPKNALDTCAESGDAADAAPRECQSSLPDAVAAILDVAGGEADAAAFAAETAAAFACVAYSCRAVSYCFAARAAGGSVVDSAAVLSATVVASMAAVHAQNNSAAEFPETSLKTTARSSLLSTAEVNVPCCLVDGIVVSVEAVDSTKPSSTEGRADVVLAIIKHSNSPVGGWVARCASGAPS
jgi:hypothetical protein